MKILSLASMSLAVALVVSGCGPSRYVNGLPVIASANDTGIFDRSPLPEGQAGIVYDPDGCQAWLIDDGLEGYASNRLDPSTGLPICNAEQPPGTVVNNYRTNNIIELYPR